LKDDSEGHWRDASDCGSSPIGNAVLLAVIAALLFLL